MTDSTSRTLASWRDHHDRLTKVIENLSPEELSTPSAADEWSVAQVLSHLGSAAEIYLGSYAAGVEGKPAPEVDARAIWARWDASTPEEQAQGFLEHDERLLALVEGLSVQQRANVTVDVGFLPEPVPLSTALDMRFVEIAAHAWDVLAGLEADAPLDAEGADIVLDYWVGAGAQTLGWAGKPDRIRERAVVALDGYTLTVDDGVTLTRGEADDATATFHGPREAVVRLVLGRLKPGFTHDEITVSGNVSLDELRKAFPGY